MTTPTLSEAAPKGYAAWREFYAGRVTEWMTADELRAEVGRLSEAGAPAPELLLIHAMRLLDAPADVPALPDAEYVLAQPDRPYDPGYVTGEDGYTADQMRAYGAACRAAGDVQPAALEWSDAPRRTEWGQGMQEATIALGRDHTLNLYAEAEAVPMVAQALAAYAARAAGDVQPVALSGKWEGAEEWMPLAWELCAEECGEDACNELVWEGGPVPEPWGDRWLKYEDEAKRLIALVRKCVPGATPTATPAAQVPAPLTDAEIGEGRNQWAADKTGANSPFSAGVKFAERAHGIGTAPTGRTVQRLTDEQIDAAADAEWPGLSRRSAGSC